MEKERDREREREKFSQVILVSFCFIFHQDFSFKCVFDPQINQLLITLLLVWLASLELSCEVSIYTSF